MSSINYCKKSLKYLAMDMKMILHYHEKIYLYNPEDCMIMQLGNDEWISIKDDSLYELLKYLLFLYNKANDDPSYFEDSTIVSIIGNMVSVDLIKLVLLIKKSKFKEKNIIREELITFLFILGRNNMLSDLTKIQERINEFKKDNPNVSIGDLSDTFHSFNELYHQKAVLLALALINIPYSWKSRKHEDGTMYDGMFVVGTPTPNGMITYHIDNEHWDLYKIPELPHAPHFTGYTPQDVLDRLEKFILDSNTSLIDEKSYKAIEDIVLEEIRPVFGNDNLGWTAYVGFYNR